MKRNGQEWYRNVLERAGMKPNGQEWYRNIPERAGMTPEYTEMCPNESAINTNMVSPT